MNIKFSFVMMMSVFGCVLYGVNGKGYVAAILKEGEDRDILVSNLFDFDVEQKCFMQEFIAEIDPCNGCGTDIWCDVFFNNPNSKFEKLVEDLLNQDDRAWVYHGTPWVIHNPLTYEGIRFTVEPRVLGNKEQHKVVRFERFPLQG